MELSCRVRGMMERVGGSIPGEQAASAKAWPPPRGPRVPLQSSRQTRDRIWFVFLKDL